jgi:addiction module HigA family antidote
MPKPTIQHPGTLVKTLLDEYQLTPAKFAADVKLSQSSIRLLLNSKLKVSVPLALRFAKYFGNTPEFWIDLQNKYELSEAGKNAELVEILKSIQKAKKPAPGKQADKAKSAGRGKADKAKPPRKPSVRKIKSAE